MTPGKMKTEAVMLEIECGNERGRKPSRDSDSDFLINTTSFTQETDPVLLSPAPYSKHSTPAQHGMRKRKWQKRQEVSEEESNERMMEQISTKREARTLILLLLL